MSCRPLLEPIPYSGDNSNDADSNSFQIASKQQQHTPDHLYQTSSEGCSIMSSSKYATAAFVSSAGLGVSDIDSMYNMTRPEDLLDSLHHHIQLQQQQQQQQSHHHQQQQREGQYQQRLRHQQELRSSVDPMQNLGLLSAFDPCSVPSTSSTSTIAPLATTTETSPTYISFLPSFHSLPLPPPGIPSFSPPSSSVLTADAAAAPGDENGHYFIDSTTPSHGGLMMMESRRSMAFAGHHSSSSCSSFSSSSSASSSKASSPSASSSLVSSPISTHFDESTVMLPAITACASCKRSHIKCDSGRPCQNCLKHPSKALTCRDATPKPRGRPKGGSKAAAEAIALARMYQQQQQQHQLLLQEHLHHHHQQQQQPGYVPRPRVMSLPQQPTARSAYQAAPTVSLQQQQQYLDYHHVQSRSSPASPATSLEHRVLRLGRRPSLPVWHHPYAMHSSSHSYTSPSPFIASPVSSGHMGMSTMRGDALASAFPSFSASTLQQQSNASATLALTSMAQEFSHPPSIGSPNSRNVVLAHQGFESMSLMQQQQQQHRVAAAPLAQGGTPMSSSAMSRQTSITESNDPQAWLALQMLQQSLPPSSSMSLAGTITAPLTAMVSSPAVSPCLSTVSNFSSGSTASRLLSFKQHQHALSEEREMIKEEEDMCIGMGINFDAIGHHYDRDTEGEDCELEREKKEEEEEEEEEETEVQGRHRMEAMLQQQQHEMQVELQFLQQRQRMLQQEQVQREQALACLHLQQQQQQKRKQQQPLTLHHPQQHGHGPVAFF